MLIFSVKEEKSLIARISAVLGKSYLEKHLQVIKMNMKYVYFKVLFEFSL